MSWAEWWLIGLVVAFLGRCIYELRHLASKRVVPLGLCLVGFVCLSGAVFLTLAAITKVFGGP